MNPQGMFRFYASLPFLILGAIIIVAIVKIISAAIIINAIIISNPPFIF